MIVFVFYRFVCLEELYCHFLEVAILFIKLISVYFQQILFFAMMMSKLNE